MVSTDLLIALQVHLVRDFFMFLKLSETTRKISLGQPKLEAWNFLANLSELLWVPIIDAFLNFLNNLLNKSDSGSFITQMGPDRVFGQLTNKYISKTIKNAWRHEELFELILSLVREDVVMNGKRHVLHQCSVGHIVA